MDPLILGAGVRPAAFSALRIGRSPACVDLFSDADLVAACPSTRIEASDYPDGLLAVADRFPPTDWLYTGALENHPDLVNAISRRHRLLGNPGANLRAVRDPIALSLAVRAAGLEVPEVLADPSGLPEDGSWLRKPLASAAGGGIEPWIGQVGRGRRTYYYQKRIDGLPLASIHIGDGSTARLMGITRQLLGRPGRPFAYRGSVGPWPVNREVRERVERLGGVIASAFGLVGIFGIDFILRDGLTWPVEVNPRYTASVEILEWTLGRSILGEHLRAFGIDVPEKAADAWHPAFAAKAILYADRPCSWPGEETGRVFDPIRFPEVADVPHPGTSFGPGEPVLTVFAGGLSIADCLAELDRRTELWRPP